MAIENVTLLAIENVTLRSAARGGSGATEAGRAAEWSRAVIVGLSTDVLAAARSLFSHRRQ